MGVRAATVTRWHRDGTLTAVRKLPGTTGALLFDARDVDRLRESRDGSTVVPGPSRGATVVDDPGRWVCPECGRHIVGWFDDLRAHRRDSHGRR